MNLTDEELEVTTKARVERQIFRAIELCNRNVLHGTPPVQVTPQWVEGLAAQIAANESAERLALLARLKAAEGERERLRGGLRLAVGMLDAVARVTPFTPTGQVAYETVVAALQGEGEAVQ